MNKTILKLAALLLIGNASAQTTIEEGLNNVNATSVNAISPWFITNADNVGLALSVTAGSCKVEITSDFTKYCKNNTVIPFDWDVDAPLTAGQKKFLSYTSGISCVRLNCAAGTGTLLLRRR